MHTRVLITGGAGFIAYHLACRLLGEGCRLTLLDNLNSYYSPDLKRRNLRDLGALGAVDVVEADILDVDALDRTFARVQPEQVVHLAAWAGVRPSLENPALYSNVNVTGTVNLLESARKFGVASFIFGSSSSVYGDTSKVPFCEDDPVGRPVSPYAATKRAGELLAHTYAHNYELHTTCLRFFTVYGPRQRPEMAIHKFARMIWDGEELPLYGDGTARRDYTYVDDIVSGITAALSVNPQYEVLNLGGARTVSLLELVSHLENALGRRARVRFLPTQPGDVTITNADVSRARRILGYEPTTPFDVGIRRFAEWFVSTRR